MFVGRKRELEWLGGRMAQVETSGHGEFVAVRGRRQVGKSTLLDHFIARSEWPAVYFAASRGALPEHELAEFCRLVAASGTGFSGVFDSVTPQDWSGALRLIAEAIDRPTVLVLDEFPWLTAGRPDLEGSLQTAWDRYLSRVPVLLVALGSDLSMMEQLGGYGRPLYQRMRELVLDPLHVAETADMLDLDAARAVDAHLVAGGFPRILQDWPRRTGAMEFVTQQLTDSTSPLVVVGERILTAEFPPSTQARDLLATIGGGETTFGTIGRSAGISQGSLGRSLTALVQDRRVVSADRPLSAHRSRLTRYAIADPYLRFWLRFIAPRMELILRGRGGLAAEQIAASWSEYRGRAVEPLVRLSIERLLPDDRLGTTRHVGAYWTRSNDVEVDLIGSPRPEAPTDVTFVGSIKWRDRGGFGVADARHLAAQRAGVPGAGDAPLVGVARNEVTGDVDVALTAEDLVAAWR